MVVHEANEFEVRQVAIGDILVELALPLVFAPEIGISVVECSKVWVGDTGEVRPYCNVYNRVAGKRVRNFGRSRRCSSLESIIANREIVTQRRVPDIAFLLLALGSVRCGVATRRATPGITQRNRLDVEVCLSRGRAPGP